MTLAALSALLALAAGAPPPPDAAGARRRAPPPARAEDPRDADLLRHLDEVVALELLEDLDLFEPAADDPRRGGPRRGEGAGPRPGRDDDAGRAGGGRQRQ